MIRLLYLIAARLAFVAGAPVRQPVPLRVTASRPSQK